LALSYRSVNYFYNPPHERVDRKEDNYVEYYYIIKYH
jgi:hypothetical protein